MMLQNANRLNRMIWFDIDLAVFQYTMGILRLKPQDNTVSHCG